MSRTPFALTALATLVAGVLLAGLGAPASAASGSDPRHPVVERAARALDGDAVPDQTDALPALPGLPGLVARADAGPRKLDPTIALRDLFLARPTLGGDDAAQARALLARPTQRGADPYGDGYDVPSLVKCSTHFCIHWVTSTADAATTAWVDTTLRTMEQVWAHHIGQLGYRAPPSDGARGGNAKFDVYLKELGNQGLYGYCAPERRVSGRPHAASSFCVLDNDFSRAEFHTAPLSALRVTAAHEFFHAIQFGYDYTEDTWILEATAVWMEERFADSINDNRQYLPYGQVGIPSAPLDTFDSSGFNQYGNWPFFEYLSEHYGNSIVRKIWQHLGNGRSAKAYSIQGAKQVLASHGGLPAVYAAYAAGNLVPGKTYDEGAHFPATQVSAKHVFSTSKRRWTTSVGIDHLAAKDLQLAPGSSVRGRWTLTLRVDGPDRSASPAAYVIVRKGKGKIVKHPVRLDADGDGVVHVGFGRGQVKGVNLTLANVSTRYRCHRGSTFSCRGTSRDDHRRFGVTASIAHH